MRIGIPKEIKTNENRVAATPATIAAFAAAGHEVFVETGAGTGSGISDGEYRECGANILPDAASVWTSAEMIMKVKEPLPAEFPYLRPDLILFTYLHLAPENALASALLRNQVISIGYETVQLDSGALPLLEPMSEVAGKMAIQIGAHFLARHNGSGAGILLGGVPGVMAGSIVIIGGGVVGANAAKIASGLGARVTLLDIKIDRLRYLDDIFGGRVMTCAANPNTIAKAVQAADLVVGAVLIPGAKAPTLVTEKMVQSMKPGSVIIDVAIDQGGCIATMDRATTHTDPVFEKYGVLHYAVSNMPGAVPRTSTFALTNVTQVYALQLAAKGWKTAARENAALARGFNTVQGKCTCKGVALAQNLAYTPIEDMLR